MKNSRLLKFTNDSPRINKFEHRRSSQWMSQIHNSQITFDKSPKSKKLKVNLNITSDETKKQVQDIAFRQKSFTFYK